MQRANENSLEEQFGFLSYHDFEERNGWLLNYVVTQDIDTSSRVKFYFVDAQKQNFSISIPFFPSLILETDEINFLEEYLRKKYEGEIECTEIISRMDINIYNHLSLKPGNYLRIYFKNEIFFSKAVKDLKKIISKNKVLHKHETIYEDFSFFKSESQNMNINCNIKEIYEYDIPYEVVISVELNIKCGSWYEIKYEGEKYIINPLLYEVPPELRIFAFDIETTKQPLKFPNAEIDEVMMISILTSNTGTLIVNRLIVSEDISDFEYSPKEDMKSEFKIYNEMNEEALLLRFYEIIQDYKPHVITTYNGNVFDFPFIFKRSLKYDLNMGDIIGFNQTRENFVCNFIVHLDCYKWVKRDSYLPIGSQGLKSVAKAKLNYFPDEMDPELMMFSAKNEPQKLASYSVSDAVATFYLYLKYVHPFIFSLSTLIPLPPHDVIDKGSGTLCESLLIAECMKNEILVPPKKNSDDMLFYKGFLVETMTYVGGHVECLKAGIYRSDFEYDFVLKTNSINKLIEQLEIILKDFRNEEFYEEVIKKIKYKLTEYIINGNKSNETAENNFNQSNNKNVLVNKIKLREKPLIYHLDVAAMYPNIILTNRLQPYSIVTDENCMRCDFNNKNNLCKREMDWVLRVEYLIANKKEIEMLEFQLENEYFKIEENIKPVIYKNLPQKKKNEILKERIKNYSKKIYNKIYKSNVENKSSRVCQREVSFYVDTVRKFRDQRYFYKKKFQNAKTDLENEKSDEKKEILSKMLVVYESLQIAHKCILNSFYGYVMRKGARWYSMEMAAIVCNTGGSIIKEARNFIEGIGIPLELDTDGIWCLIPESFPDTFLVNKNKKISFLCIVLNYLISQKFTNQQYQEKIITNDCNSELTSDNKSSFINTENFLSSNTILNSDQRKFHIKNKYEIKPYNSIEFEIDVPYKAMVLPSSTEEGKQIKKRYVVINMKDKISELKGFESKRRGELKIIKKFQEELFNLFTKGSNLQECYKILGDCCNYWLGIINTKGKYLSDDDIFELFAESKNMSKRLEKYDGRKTTATCTAKRLGDLLGNEILNESGLKCEYVIARYPEKKPITDRAIPVNLFYSIEEVKNKYLNQWLGIHTPIDIRDLLDWNYYFERLETIMQKIVVIPAFFQNISNPIDQLRIPNWVFKNKKNESLKKLNFICDLEETVKDYSIKKVKHKTLEENINFKNKSQNQEFHNKESHNKESLFNIQKEINCNKNENYLDLLKKGYSFYINSIKNYWKDDFFKKNEERKESNNKTNILGIEVLENGTAILHKSINENYISEKIYPEKKLFINLLVENIEDKNFSMEKGDYYIDDSLFTVPLYCLKLLEKDYILKFKLISNFFDHLCVKSVYEEDRDIIYNIYSEYENEAKYFTSCFVLSFHYYGKDSFIFLTENKIYILSKSEYFLKKGIKNKLYDAFNGFESLDDELKVFELRKEGYDIEKESIINANKNTNEQKNEKPEIENDSEKVGINLKENTNEQKNENNFGITNENENENEQKSEKLEIENENLINFKEDIKEQNSVISNDMKNQGLIAPNLISDQEISEKPCKEINGGENVTTSSKIFFEQNEQETLKEVNYFKKKSETFESIHFKNKFVEIITDLDLKKFITKYFKRKTLFVMNYNDSNRKLLSSLLEKRHLIFKMNLKNNNFLMNSFNSILNCNLELLRLMCLKYRNILEISFYSKIPVLNIPINYKNHSTFSSNSSDFKILDDQINKDNSLELINNLKNNNEEQKIENLKINNEAHILHDEISSEILDFMFYKEAIKNNLLLTNEEYLDLSVLKDEYYNEGYNGSYCYEFECVGTLILSILEAEKFKNEDFFIQSKEFNVFRNFIKNIFKDSVLYGKTGKNSSKSIFNKSNDGLKNDLKLTKDEISNTKVFCDNNNSTKEDNIWCLIKKLQEYFTEPNKDYFYNAPGYLLGKIPIWVKKETKLLSKKFRQNLKILQQKYIIELVGKLKSMGVHIISVNKEIITISTGKLELSDAENYFGFLQNSISKIRNDKTCISTGFSFDGLTFRLLRIHKSMIYINPQCYFFLSTQNEIYSNCKRLKIPLSFLKMVLIEEKIENNYFYSSIMNKKIKNSEFIKSIKICLKIASYLKDISELKSNSFKMLRISEFEYKNNLNRKLKYLMFDILCKKCNTDNILRIHLQTEDNIFFDNICTKCYSDFDTDEIERVCMEYVYYKTDEYLCGETFCLRCHKYNERRLKEFCVCGDVFITKDYKKEFNVIKDYVKTKKMSDFIDHFMKY
ncbi:catalytic subunit A of DNA polymerase epsilon [Hamiltosporidium tvaerminnensis]|uniref:DNA polymerase epsilon catalytic subunit n=1 Tax=Hamiltosporidium tvaerminnensis TaxID=1176355 RepID=A0A4Q9L7B6_9MICR|nr:catalytic subunit A of DNA polymerase epsilon [Hamiltosporidium tvaerminnensis]